MRGAGLHAEVRHVLLQQLRSVLRHVLAGGNCHSCIKVMLSVLKLVGDGSES